MTDPAPDALDRHDASRVAAHGTVLRLVSYGASLLISVLAIRLLTTHPRDRIRHVYRRLDDRVRGRRQRGRGPLDARLARGRERLPPARLDLLANLLGLRIVLCSAGIVAAVLFTAATGRSSTIVFGVAVVGAGITIAMLQQAVALHLQLELRNAIVATLELVRTVALAATYAVLVYLDAGLRTFYFAPAIAGIALLAATTLVVPLGLFRPRFDRAAWGRMLRAVLPYAFAAAVALLYFRVTQITMEYAANAEETNQYALAFRIVEVLSVIPGLVASTALPLIARSRSAGPERLRPLASALAQTALLAGIGLATTTAAAAPIAIRVIGGGADSPSITVLRVLAIALAFTFPLAIWSFLLLTVDRVRALSIAGAAAAATALAVAVALIPPYGANGGAVATVVAEALLATALLVALARYDRGLVPPAARFARPIAAALPAAAIILLTRNSGALAPLAAIPAFALAAVLLRAIPPELWDILRMRRAS